MANDCDAVLIASAVATGLPCRGSPVVGETASMKRRKLWKTGEDGCVAPAVLSKLGWIPRHCWKNGVKPLLFCLFLLCCRLPPKLGETAKVYR